MKASGVLSVIAAGFLLALAQTLGTIAGAGWAIVVGAAAGLLVFPLFSLFGVEWDQWLIPTLVSVLGCSVGLFMGSLGSPEPLSWAEMSPVCAAVTCFATVFLGKRRERICQLCRQRLGTTIAFECPRCGLV